MTRDDDNLSTASCDGDGPPRWGRADVLCVVGIVLVMLVFFLPVVGDRPLNSSHEAKAGLIARQMLRDGRWFVAEIDVARINKPLLYYWLVAGLSLLTGEVSAWTIRLPNLLSCIGVVLLTWAMGRRLWDRWTGLASAAILATMLSFQWLTQNARLDSMLMLSVTGAVFCYWHALTAASKGRGWAWSLAGHLSVTLGVAVKGPIAVVLAGMVVGALVVTRRLTGEGKLWKDVAGLHPVSGALMLVVLTGPIFWGMERAWGGGFLRYFFLRENLARAGVPVPGVQRFRHGYSFLYYFGTIWIHAVPWSLFVPAALLPAARRPEGTSRTDALLPLLYLAGPFLFLSAVSIKSWLYLMPIFPPLAMILGRLWMELARGRYLDSRYVRWMMRLVVVLLVPPAATLVVVPAWLMAPDVVRAVLGPVRLIYDRLVALPPEVQACAGSVMKTVVPGAAALALLVTAMAAIWRGRYRTAFAAYLAVAVVGAAYHNFVSEPAGRPVRSQRDFARRVGAWLDGHPEFAGSDVYVCGGEPYELLFYLDRPVRVIRRPDTPAFLERIRRADSKEPGGRAAVLLRPRWFEHVSNEVGGLPVILSAHEHSSTKLPRVLTVVKLVEPAGP